jgi:hypothetical protein
MIDAKIQACIAQLCACPLGQMLSNGGNILNMYIGGICCCNCCPAVKKDDLAKPSNTPQGACARIKQEELEAPARREAVRCLAYADCRWYPEAEAALIVALRTDRNECVRLEAARVLGVGCCCTRRTIEALTRPVSDREPRLEPTHSIQPGGGAPGQQPGGERAIVPTASGRASFGAGTRARST